MKRILSMLLALIMVISLVPVAASAAEVASGLATASRDTKWTYTYTAPADGTLTITVGDGTTAWASDVMNFSNFSNSEDVTGTEQGSYTYDVTAGTKYSIRIFGQGSTSAAITDVPYSIVFTPASGEEEDTTITVKGELATDDSGVAMTGTDVEVNNATQISHSFTPTANGIMTVHIKSATNSWKITGEGISSQEGTGEAAVEYQVYGGQTYGITLGCYADWDWAAGTIAYDILFYQTELAVEQEEYIITDALITGEGEYSIAMEENAKMTVVTFTPAQTGIYTITASEGATVANCGGGSWFINTSAEFASSVEWTCEEVAGEYVSDGETYVAEGQSLMLGIKSETSPVTITVEKTGEYVEEEIELIPYENKAELAEFTLPEGSVLGSYVNVSDTVDHTAVLGTDGYYHLDSEAGDVLLIDMDYQEIILTAKLNSEIPTMYAYVTLDDGTEVKYDIAEAVQAYEAVCDENMYYPLTEDLIFFYQVYATDNGTWIFHDLETVDNRNADAWLYCCRTVTLPVDENATSGVLNISDGATVQWTAPATGTVQFTVTPSANTVPIFLPGTYQPILEITTGSGTLEVTEGVVYEIMDAYNGGSTVAWEYVEGGDDEITYTAVSDSLTVEVGPYGYPGDENMYYAFTAPSAGTLTINVGTAMMNGIGTAAIKSDEINVTLGVESNTAELTLDAGEVVYIDATCDTCYTLSLTWAGESSGEETSNTLVLGDNAVSVPAGMSGGSWTYTATEAGTLSASVTALTLVEPDYENEGQYVDNVVPETQVNMVVGMQMSFLINGVDALNNTVQVNAGDEVTVQLSHRMGTEFKATINLALGAPEQGGDEGGETEGDGTASNPYIITELPYTVSATGSHDLFYTYEVAEDCTLTITYVAGNFVSFTNCEYEKDSTNYTYTVTCTGGTTITINPWGTSDGDYVISLAENETPDVPVEPAGPGTEEDPYIITAFPSETAVPLTENNMSAGIWYQYTATAASKFAADFPGFVNFKVNGNEVYFLEEVNAGDVILINVGAWYIEEGVDYTLKIYDPTVAKIGDVVYTDFATAIYNAVSGDTITLLSDVEVGDVMVVPGVNLDLNGYTLTADYIAVFNGANIVDNSADNTGLLVVDGDNAIISANNSQIPVWNNNGFVFSAVDHSRARVQNQTEDGFLFAFQPQFQAAAKALIQDGGADNGITIEARISWETEMGPEYRNLIFKENWVATAISNANGALKLTVTGLSAITGLEEVTVEAVVRSETGVYIASTGIVVSI